MTNTNPSIKMSLPKYFNYKKFGKLIYRQKI